jgi:hypothetical protein
MRFLLDLWLWPTGEGFGDTRRRNVGADGGAFCCCRLDDHYRWDVCLETFSRCVVCHGRHACDGNNIKIIGHLSPNKICRQLAEMCTTQLSLPPSPMFVWLINY